MADGRHLGKIKKSSYLGPGLTDFDKSWHGDALKIRSIALCDGWTYHHEIGTLTQFGPLDYYVSKIGRSSCTF